MHAYYIMILWILLQLFVVIFNKTSYINRKVLFEVGTQYQLELNVTSIRVAKKEKTGMDDCALIPRGKEPKHKPI